jgi:hypothetical protein
MKVADKIDAIEQEIEKLEDRLARIMQKKTVSEVDKKIQGETASLLKNVIEDLRKQQQKLMNPKSQER